MITPYNCVIVANGSFPQTNLPLRFYIKPPWSLPVTEPLQH